MLIYMKKLNYQLKKMKDYNKLLMTVNVLNKI